jgi:cytochrome c peroxidase
MKSIFVLLLTFTLLLGCSKGDDESSAYVDIPIQLKTPSNFPPMAYDLENNPITLKGFELGKKLFYDGRLSSDGTISCGFCHEQRHAFTHHGHTVSQGVDGQTGTRNTPLYRTSRSSALLCMTAPPTISTCNRLFRSRAK